MQITRRRSDAQQRRADPGKLQKYRVDQILSRGSIAAERDGMPEERPGVAVIQLTQRLRAARRQICQQRAIPAVVSCLGHSRG